MPTAVLTKRGLAQLPPVTRRTIFFDRDLVGFGLRVSPRQSGAPPVRSWIVEYRVGGGRTAQKRRMVIGDASKLDPDQARREARALLAQVELGADPVADRARTRETLSITQLSLRYVTDHVRAKRKATTARSFASLVRIHIEPRLGSRRADSLKRRDLAVLHAAIGERQPSTANRTLTFLATVFNWAERYGYLPEGHPNPCKGIERFKERRLERYLSSEEFARLGASLVLAETVGIRWEPDPNKKIKHAPKPENRSVIFDPAAVAAIRLLIFTGCRLREILHLRWDEVDLERRALFLRDTKTGRRAVMLGGPAVAVLEALQRFGPYVILGATPEKPRADLNRPWARIRAYAGLADVRLHDLRHSFASVGAGSGLGLPIIGKLLGHASVVTTERYAHLADDPLREGAELISRRIEQALEGRPKASDAA